ncbi:MAG: response regulator [Chloroflexi bacterium]|nr:response regulator [Chloroflexota bacterium]MCH9038568.1 response regulator [Chloroflexota bacterium]
MLVKDKVRTEKAVSATRTIIVEDEPLFRQLILSLLAGDPEIDVVAEASTGEDAIGLAERLQPEVVLMDIELGSGMSGIEAGFAIKFARPSTGIVVLSSHVNKQLIVNSGGWSYLLKRNVRDISSVTRAIRGASWGMLVIDPQITEMLNPRANTALVKLTVDQLQLLERVAHGMSDMAIAEEMAMAEPDISRQLVEICQVLQIKLDNRVDTRVAVVKAYLDQTRGF